MKNISTTVLHNDEVARQCFRLVLSGPMDDFHIRPGQFVMLKISKGHDPLLRRPFAAFRFGKNGDVFLEIYYQVVGRGTRLMAQIVPGTSLEVLGPLGNGFTKPPVLHDALVIAGGMGIVPLRGLIHHLSVDSSVHLSVFLGAQSAENLLFRDELRRMGISIYLSTEDGTLGHHGLVTELFQQFLEKDSRNDLRATHCFACGPWPMLSATARILAKARIPCQVSLESRMACGFGACLGCVVEKKPKQRHQDSPQEYTRICFEGPVFDAQEIAWDH